MDINCNIQEHDSLTIQAAIDRAYERNENKVVIPRINARTGEALWEIKETIFLPSDFTLILDNCHLRMADGVYCNMFCNRNAYAKECEEQKNIIITGIGNVVLDGGLPNGLTEKTSLTNGFPSIINNTMIFFRNVSGFSVENIHIKEQRWWGMTFMYCEHGRISNINFSATNIVPNQDGIDLRAGCHDIVIENIFGKTGDDTIALTAVTGTLFQDFKVKNKDNNIYNVIIRNVNACVTGGHHIVRLLNHDGIQLYNILIDGIMDCSEDVKAKAALKIGDSRYSKIRRATLHETHNITARNIISRAKTAILLGGTAADSYFSNIQQYGGYAIKSECCEVENLYFDGVTVNEGELYSFEKTTGDGVVINNMTLTFLKNVTKLNK
ncbi:MAG: hypothetical protein J6N52_10705 [Clostridia bacterium]|nr:hypothetical protein [Clostridia bacterium]